MEKIKPISNLLQQLVLTRLGIYCSERLGIDDYYLIQTINFMIPEIGEETIKKEIPDFDKIKEILEEVTEHVGKSKIFYDSLSDVNKVLNPGMKSKVPDEVQEMIKREFRRNSSKVNLLQPEIYRLFVTLIRLSGIQNLTIRNEYFKILEHKQIGKPGDTRPPERKESEKQ